MLSREVCKQCCEYEGEEASGYWICHSAEDADTYLFWVCEKSKVPKACQKIFEHTVSAGMKHAKS